jgi:hypothetical protein
VSNATGRVREQLPTLVGHVYGKSGTNVDARYEVLVLKLGHFVKVSQDHLRGKVHLTRTMHDKQSIPSALLELPLSLERCICNSRSGPAVVRPMVTRIDEPLMSDKYDNHSHVQPYTDVPFAST